MAQSPSFEQTLSVLQDLPSASFRFKRGIEKEGLRVLPNVHISQRHHQKALGSPLTHSSITTDYSEALLEFITPVSEDAESVLQYLQDVHSFVSSEIDDEIIWPASMPCIIEDELDVPIAEYGTSNIGQMKHIYRHGLWHRYGRKMQCIAGVHYNFSVDESIWKALAETQSAELNKDFISQGYFSLVRNFRRFSWLLFYLFGASPALDKSFVDGKQHNLEALDDDTLYSPYATSLRMSDLGYQNNAQDGLFVCFNGLPTYTATLKHAMGQSVPAYEEIGIESNGQYKQLNTNLLQIENEYYSDVRPKRNSISGEKPLTSLNEYGVEYIEVRCLDLNPFEPLGVSLEQVRFMDLFLSYCLFKPSPKLSDAECQEVSRNQKQVVVNGRHPQFTLERHGERVLLTNWAEELLAAMQPLAELMDSKTGQNHYQDALLEMQKRVQNPELTPSATILRELKQRQQSFADFTFSLGQQHAEYFARQRSQLDIQQWQSLSEQSLNEQARMESEEEMDFAAFLAEYSKKM
ncbi:glutamate--cysteine ligase [Bermanella marisrubri]|uniref:Glutamate--cysteine ligase n=1 Tax=Bermanella marisrubri TaxID=207949 RepID=Q1MYZ9_9GAMM|nr:glutamate--cysteine ligase [Bermanella marisrubri]EAT11229.1 glutamate--cysteine ligase [Oceanobacter sp. RED65] [Bermanella marisrubri]QIZ85637.1 glutamate--cysteine ligase [Bermanella marisrubri]